MGAAALYTIAALLKPPLGGGILVSYGIVQAGRKRIAGLHGSWQRFGRPTLAFALGAALPLLATTLYFGAHGALGALYEAVFVFAPGYTSVDLSPGQLPGFVWLTLHGWLLGLSPYNVVGLLLFAFLPALHPAERRAAFHVLGVVAFSLLGVALQAKFFQYHFAAALLLTALPAGWGYWKAYLRARASWRAALLIGPALLILLGGWLPLLPDRAPFWEHSTRRFEAWLRPERREAIHARLYGTEDFNPGANRRAAEWIAAHTPPDAILYVWGFEPGIYDMAGRTPASRYIYNVPQRAAWSREAARAELLRDLAARPPAVIVVEKRDRLPWVTGDNLDSREALRQFPELFTIVQEQYEPAVAMDNLLILTRKKP